MRIGLHDAEKEHLKHKTFPNYALMKISAYHKSIGDTVEWWNPFEEYDKVYSSKVMDFTPVNEYLPPNAIKGGTGYGIYENLPHGIEQLRELSWTDYKIDLNQGMDIRLVTDEICTILKDIKWLKYIRFSCDRKAQLPYFEKAVKLFDKHKIPKSKIFIYLLVRKDISEAEERLKALCGIYKHFHIYAQPERNEPKGIVPDKMQLEFAQRYVYGRCYNSESWQQYIERHKGRWENGAS